MFSKNIENYQLGIRIPTAGADLWGGGGFGCFADAFFLGI